MDREIKVNTFINLVRPKHLSGMGLHNDPVYSYISFHEFDKIVIKKITIKKFTANYITIDNFGRILEVRKKLLWGTSNDYFE